jgi:hypothetical protein
VGQHPAPMTPYMLPNLRSSSMTRKSRWNLRSRGQ